MKPLTTILRVTHGSHLYGTSTPTSDTDFKSVHIPSGEAIILQRAENVVNLDVKSKMEGTLKNASDAIDEQSYSVAKFYDMLMKGDTVATEMLFAPRASQNYASWVWDEIVQPTGKLLLNRECKGFVGYCVRQAAKYGVKGSRMAAVKGMLDHLQVLSLGRPLADKLGIHEDSLRRWSEGKEHVSWENIPNPNGSDSWHLNVCDRKMPMTVTIEEAYKVWNKVWENYGQRARAAMTNEGIDWKAVSHAVRVAGQAQELLSTGQITFPRPDAAWLTAIKKGEVDYKLVERYLEDQVELVQKLSETSVLPEKSDHKLADKIIRDLYLEQVI